MGGGTGCSSKSYGYNCKMRDISICSSGTYILRRQRDDSNQADLNMVWGLLESKAPGILVTNSRPWPDPSPTDAEGLGSKTWGSLAQGAPQVEFA